MRLFAVSVLETHLLAFARVINDDAHAKRLKVGREIGSSA